MKYIRKRYLKSLLLLGGLIAVAVVLFLTYQTYGNWEFALKLRGKKLVALVVVGIGASFSAISFQTVTENQFLTPNILGLDSLYTLVQTLLYFFLGTSSLGFANQKVGFFFVNVIIMMMLSGGLFTLLLGKHYNLYLVLMIGMVLGTFFRSISTFLQVVMDPNEYDKLQGKLFASFETVDVHLVWIALLLTVLLCAFLWGVNKKLDVLHLGRDQALSLGVSVRTFQISVLLAVSGLVAISTALVGPVTFLGFIVANVTYQLFHTYRHEVLFIGGALVSILFLVAGQFLVEQVFDLNTTLSVVVEFAGGVYFVWKILHERKSSL